MMSKRVEFWVGLFVVLGVVLLAGLTYYFQQFKWQTQYYVIYAKLPFGGGIMKGTPVRAAGVQIGKVKEITWDSREQVIKAVLAIDADIRIREDAKLVLDSEGMLGEAYLEFTRGSPEKGFLKPGSWVEGTVPPTMTDIKVAGLEMLKSARKTIEDVRALIAYIGDIAGDEKFKNNLKATIANTALIAENASKSASSMQKIAVDLGDAVTQAKVVLAKLEKATEETTRQIQGRGDQLKQLLATTNDFVKEMKASTANLRKTIDNLADITTAVRESDSTAHNLLYEREMYDSLVTLTTKASEAADNLNALIIYLRERPQAIVWGEGPLGITRLWRWFLGLFRRRGVPRFEDLETGSTNAPTPLPTPPAEQKKRTEVDFSSVGTR